jgi:two-component system, LytTR family, sensor kinase
MQWKLQKFKNLKLAILFSAILSLFGVITNHTPPADFNILLIIPGWLLTFSFLLAAWYLNSILTNLFFFNLKKWNLISKTLVIFFSNALLLILFMLLSVLISKTFHLVKEYNYLFLIARGIVSIAIIYLIQYTLNLNARNQSVLLQNQMLKTENIRAQFEMLRQQISPHFLFNSLSSLRAMIRSSNNNAENFVIKLSDIYRLLLAKNETDTIALKEELEFIEDYSFLLYARYEHMLRIEIDISPHLFPYKIPTFTLQLLLENCVKHNIVSKEKPLHIKIFDSGIKSISVENNLQRISQAGEAIGIGLQNLIKRYNILGVPDGVQIFSDESVYRVKIKLLDP